MAKIANLPSRESLFKPILKAMISKGGRCFVDDVLTVVARKTGLSDRDLIIRHKKNRAESEFRWQLRWCLTILKGKGYLKQERAGDPYVVTRSGRKFVERVKTTHRESEVDVIKPRVVAKPEFSSVKISQLLKWYDKGHGALNLEPEFQRSSVWSKSERSKLMDTILRGYPLPAVVFYKHRDSETYRQVYDAIDGKQRIESILLFLGEMKGKDKDFEAAFTHVEDDEEVVVKSTWKHLSELNQKCILRYEMPVVWLCGAPSEVREIFVRINSTGKALSKQEIRRAKYFKSGFLKEMTKVAASVRSKLLAMGVLSEAQITRMKDIEFVSELVLSVMQNAVQDKKRILDRAMTPNGVDLRSLGKAVRRFKAALKRVGKILPDICETRYNKAADFYTLLVLMARLEDEGMALDSKKSCAVAGALLHEFGRRADVAYENIRNGLGTDDRLALAYVQTVREGGDAASHRRDREKILRELLHDVFADKDVHRTFSDVQRRIIWDASKKKRCCKCNKELKWGHFEIDHIVPYSKGGKTSLANSALICKSCNGKKGNRTSD